MISDQTEPVRKSKRKALGKGLGALLPTNAEGTSGQSRDYFMCKVANIRPAPKQPRRHFDEEAIAELAQSIKESGLIQPLVVRSVDGSYELIAGERRWRACQVARVDTVPVVVKDVSDADAFALALVENIQRQDLNPLEEAAAYQRLLEEFGFTQKSVADRVGRSRSAVANSVRLLRLPDTVQSHINNGELSAGHARALAALEAEDATELAEIMVRHGYSVREAEDLVRESKVDKLVVEEPVSPTAETKINRAPRYRDDAQVRKVAEELQTALGTKVKIRDRHGKGRIEIHYDDYDILEGILERLIGEE